MTGAANPLLEQILSSTIRDDLLDMLDMRSRDAVDGSSDSQFQRRQPGVCTSECLSIERGTACTTGTCACGYLNRVTLEYIENCALCLLTINEEDALLLPLLANMCLCSNSCLPIVNAVLPAYSCSTDACFCASVNTQGPAAWDTCISCVQAENTLNATVLFNIEQNCTSSGNATSSISSSAASPTTGVSTATISATSTASTVAHSGSLKTRRLWEPAYYSIPLPWFVFYYMLLR